MLNYEKTNLICCVIVEGIRKTCFTRLFYRDEAEKEAIGGLFKIYSKEMFLVFEMSLDVKAIIVPRDTQYVVVLNSIIEDK